MGNICKTLAAVAFLAVSGTFVRGADTPEPRMLQFNIRIFEGDPRGTREAGTVKLLTESRLRTLEGRSFNLLSGGELPVLDNTQQVHFLQFGSSLAGQATLLENGKVIVHLTLRHTRIVGQAQGTPLLRTESVHRHGSFELGEVVKLSLRKGQGKRLLWAEVTVEVVRAR